MNIRIYVRASTKEQDAERALDDLRAFAVNLGHDATEYIENHTGTKLDRPQLNKLLNESEQGDILLVESVDRLSRPYTVISEKYVLCQRTSERLISTEILSLRYLKIISMIFSGEYRVVKP